MLRSNIPLRLTCLLTTLLLATAAFAGPAGKIIYAFHGGAAGKNPYGPVTFDTHGNLFGISDEEMVYELSPSGSGWTASTVYFLPETGNALSIDPAGNIYLTLPYDGSQECGSIIQLTPDGTGGWAENNLHTLVPTEGCNPNSVVFDPVSGNLYGVAGGGSLGNGTIFELTPSGQTWNFSVIYNFEDIHDGDSPNSALTLDALGNIYGTARAGGIYQQGTVFKLTPGSNGWTETTLYDFTGGYNGSNPASGVTFDQAGNLYGTTIFGADNVGNVYKLTPTNGFWRMHVIHTFSGGPDGAAPTPFNLSIDNSGNLYGVAGAGGVYGEGVIYKISPQADGKWLFTSLHEFTGGADGGTPYCGLVFDSLGNLYGTAQADGPRGLGEVFMGTP